MELIKIYCKHFPFKGYMALIIFPWVFIREDCKKRFSKKAERHKGTHALQQVECLWIFFLPIYVLKYLVKLLITFSHKRAYYSISFEQEAYKHEEDIYYNDIRNPCAWVHYIFTLYNI